MICCQQHRSLAFRRRLVDGEQYDISVEIVDADGSTIVASDQTASELTINTSAAPMYIYIEALAESELGSGETALVTVQLMDAAVSSSTPISIESFEVTGGSLSNFTKVSDLVYNVTLTPQDDFEGVARITLKDQLVDTDGAPIAIANDFSPLVDTLPPSELVLSIADTGVSATDGLTNDTTVNVSGLESGSTWSYTLDGGSTWLPGSGTQIVLTGTTYNPGDVKAKQIDSFGNIGSGVSSSVNRHNNNRYG